MACSKIKVLTGDFQLLMGRNLQESVGCLEVQQGPLRCNHAVLNLELVLVSNDIESFKCNAHPQPRTPKFVFSPSSAQVLVLKVWSQNQQPEPLLGTCWKCKLSAPPPSDSPGWGPAIVF